MAETSNTLPPSGAPSPTPGPVSGPSGRSVFIAMGVGALVVAVALGLILSRVGSAVTYNTAGWTVFHDPGGYFTIALPPGWTIDGGQEGTGTLGDANGSYTVTDYTWVASDQSNGSSGPVVDINYHPLPTAFARQFECQNFSSTNITVDGLPASAIGDSGWILATQAAHYQVNFGFPSPDTLQTVPNTPIPAATATAGIALATQVAATFKPTPATALSC